MTPSQWFFADSSMWIVVTRSSGGRRRRPIRAAVWSVDPNQPVVRMTTMEVILAAASADRRFAFFVFGVFGAVAVLLRSPGSIAPSRGV